MQILNDFSSLDRFTARESISGQSQVKSSVQRGIRSKIAEQYPALEPYMEELMPKKAPIFLVK
ncbi:Malignant T-cell-amplified sequence 1, partial [Blyttiomyces sp. JEL0837]